MVYLLLLGTEFSRLPRVAESTKHCLELQLWVVGLHRNVSNTYTRAEVFHKEPRLSIHVHKKIKERKERKRLA